MPIGVYIRTEEIRKGISAGRLRSPKAQKAASEMGKLPKTQKQRDSARETIKIASEIGRKLPRSEKQLANSRKAQVFGDSIVCHHNDLCHGKERPDDVTYMTLSEHHSLHANLRVQDGTNPFLFMQEKPWKRKEMSMK